MHGVNDTNEGLFSSVPPSGTATPVTCYLRELQVPFVLTANELFAKNASLRISFSFSITRALLQSRGSVGLHISSSASAIVFSLTDDPA